MSRNYIGLGRYEHLFDQLDAAISRLESRCDKIERRVTNLHASKATYTQQPYTCYDSRRKLRTHPLPEPPPQLAQDMRYYSLPRTASSNYDTDPYQQPTHFQPCHGQPPGWPPPQRSPPSCWPAQRHRHAYMKQQQTHAYRQQHQPVAAHMEPLNRFGYSRPRHQSNPTPVFEHSPDTCTLSDAALQNPNAEYHVRQSDYLPPHTVESRRLSRPYLRHHPSSPSLPVVAAVPPSNLTPPALSCCPDVSGDEGELLHNDPPPPAPILQLYNLDISEEEETLLEDKEEDGSIDEGEKIIASFNVAQMSSKDVENCWFKRGGACTSVRIIAYMDFFDGDVPGIVHRSTSLDVDTRFIPPRNDTSCLTILRGVDKLFVLAWNFADNIGSLLLIFDRGDKGRHSAVRYVFDPGGDASPKLLLSTLVLGSWLPP